MFFKLLMIVTSLASNQLSLQATDVSASFDNQSVKSVVENDGLYDADILSRYNSSQNESTLFQKDFYATYYFNNLTKNFGDNRFGSCGYVSIGMLLSFWDTYWDDNVIPECYDIATILNNDAMSLDLESPGINNEDDITDGITEQNYYQVIEQYSDSYFHLFLLKMGKDLFGQYRLDDSYNPTGLTFEEYDQLLKHYLYNFRSYNSDKVNIVEYQSNDSSSVRDYAINLIKQGIPVKLGIGHSNSNGGHSVIAYDYDEEKDEIYTHFGWGPNTTHVTIESQGYDCYNNVFGIIFNTSHNHSNNFIYTSKDGDKEVHCSCHYVVPYRIDIIDGNYRDTTPTFKWNCLNHEKWFLDQNLKYHFSILNDNKISLFNTDVSSDEYKLTQNQWNITLSLKSKKYYAYVEPFSNVSPYWDDYAYSKLFAISDEFKCAKTIEPKDYNFADAYPTDESTKTEYVNHNLDNLTFRTRRYRTGYIQNEYIVMSCLRNNINSAWIEYAFDKPIIRLDVQLSYWRSVYYEHITSSNTTATIDSKINGSWSTQLDLFDSDAALPTDRSNQKWYTIVFEQPTYEIRFRLDTTYVFNQDYNRGRICIGNMAIWEHGPLSGYEFDYDTSLWAGIQSPRNNCYSYILNNQVLIGTNEPWKKQQPGEYSGSVVDILDKEHIVAAVKADFDKYNNDFGTNLIFKEVGRFEVCPKGTYKVALVVYDTDYHWYRQDSNGYWSHKLAHLPITNLDSSGQPIIDPYLADISPYEDFLGYFAVSPWGNFYEENN